MSESTTENTTSFQIKNDTSPVNIAVKAKNKFYHGGEKEKWRVKGTVGKQEDLQISLVERNFGEETDEIINKWRYCHENKISVVPFMEKTDKGTVVMPDLTADGSTVYGKGTHMHARGGHGELRKFQENDKKFWEITSDPEKVKKIEEAALEEAVKATEANVALPNDDPLELILHKDGTWNLICLDLEQLRILDPNQRYSSPLLEDNKSNISNFMLSLENIKRDLNQYQPVLSTDSSSQI